MKPNILFILIDGGRADKILTDLEDVQLPNIKKLMNQGISFTNCFTSVDGTTMSLNCIFNSNSAILRGGAIYCPEKINSHNVMELKESEFKNNTPRNIN